MTACLYISPCSQNGTPHPCFISDTQITNTTFEPNQILPHNIKFGLPSLNKLEFISRPTVKKCFQISNRSVLAVSGDSNAISCFVDTCKGEILAHEMNSERPMGDISAIANKFSRDNKGSIEVIGATMIKDQNISVLKFNKICHEDSLLGFMSAVGSGGQELMEKAINFSRNYISSNQVMNTNEFVRGLVSGITASRLTEEGLSGNSSKHWGSMLEYLSYDYFEEKWNHGLKRAFMLFLAYQTGEKEFSVGLLPRVVSYNPGVLRSRYSVITWGNEFQFSEWIADNIFDEDYDRNATIQDRQFWLGWRPEQVTFSLLPIPKLFPEKILHKTTDDSDLDQVIYEISESGVEIGVNNDILNMLGEAYAKQTGYKFKEIKDL